LQRTAGPYIRVKKPTFSYVRLAPSGHVPKH
jgi:hypothetical protein